jgi:hypothetical protein
MATINLKRGDALAFIIRRTNADGTPDTGSASKMLCQLRDSTDKLVSTFTITETSTPGDYDFYIPASETKLWAPGIYDFDIEYDYDGRPVSSDTHQVKVMKDVSRL